MRRCQGPWLTSTVPGIATAPMTESTPGCAHRHALLCDERSKGCRSYKTIIRGSAGLVIRVHSRSFAVECLFRPSPFAAILPTMIRTLDSLRRRPSGAWTARLVLLLVLLLPAVEARATRGVPRGRGLDLAGVRDHESIEAAGGIGGLLAIRERVGTGPETTRHVISDPQGNVMALADPAGTLVARFDYDPFGRLIMETGEAGSCPFRYSTKYRDPDLELYCYGHRWYDPSSMKWLTPDPIGERGGVNLTAFCANDPVNKVDALGEEPITLTAVAGYTALQAIIATAETGLEYGLHRIMADESEEFHLGATWGKNFGVNMATGGLGGKAKLATRTVRVLRFALRQGVEIAADTALDVHVYDRDLQTSLALNTVGSVGGELAVDGIGHLGRRLLRRGVADATGEAVEAAVEGAAGNTRITNPNRLLPPHLPNGVAATFEGTPTFGPIYEDLLFRGEGGRAGTYGRWFGTIRADSAASAEFLYNVTDYGNELLEQSTYKPLSGSMGWRGPVRGGIGDQIYFDVPQNNVLLLRTDPLPQSGF